MSSKRIAVVVFAVTTIFSTAVLRAQGLPTAEPESVGMSAQRLSAISAAFQKEIDKENLPGVVILVARKGRLVYSDAI